ncbi:hypothetical protein [Streptomyces sp. NPDC004230]
MSHGTPLHVPRARIALAAVTAVLALTAGTCNPEATGPAGTVTARQNNRWDCTGVRCKARLRLTVRDRRGDTHRFEVPKPTFRECQIGDAYPACKP